MEGYKIWLLIFFANVVNSETATEYILDEARLFHDKFDGKTHMTSVRPVKYPNETIEVNFGVSLQQILGLDAGDETLYTHVWMNYEWQDVQLSWNRSQYGGVKSIRVKVTDLWIPDIFPYNALSKTHLIERETAVVYSSGKVSWVPPIEMATSCALDLTKFPFDTQICTVKFGSWTYDGGKLNLTSRSPEVDITTFQPSPEFELLSSPMKRHVVTYECCPEPYIDMTMTLTLKRRTTAGKNLLVAPSVLMAMLLPVIFMLPPESREKIFFGVGLLLTDATLLSYVTEGIPRTLTNHSIPLLAAYHLINMILVGISMAVSALVMNIWSKGQRARTLPRWISRFLLAPLGKILCIKKEDIGFTPNVHQPLNEDVSNINDQNKMMIDASPSSEFGMEWRFLAIVIDRICLILFSAVVVIMVIVYGSH